jgi:hypothetical protein
MASAGEVIKSILLRCMSLRVAPKRTWHDVQSESALRDKADAERGRLGLPLVTDSVEKVARDYRRIMTPFR